jgi:lipocalin
MNKVLAFLLIGVVLVACADTTKDEKSDQRVDAAKKRMAAKGVKDFDISKLKGKWYQIGGSAALHESFLKDCRCNAVEFDKLTDNKAIMKACCRAKDNKEIKVNGTLTQNKDNKALFNLEFTGKTADVKGVNVNKTEAREVQKIVKGGEEATHPKEKSSETGNVVMLRVGKNYDSIVMGSPALDSAWILARKVQFDQKEYDECIKFLTDNGFSASKIVKINHEGCEAEEAKKGK